VGRTKSRANGDVWVRKNREGRIYGCRGTYVGPDGRRRYVSSKNKEDARRKLRAARADRGLLFDTEDLRTLRVHNQGAHQARLGPCQARCPYP
jgi:hypothetical protein